MIIHEIVKCPTCDKVSPFEGNTYKVTCSCGRMFHVVKRVGYQVSRLPVRGCPIVQHWVSSVAQTPEEGKVVYVAYVMDNKLAALGVTLKYSKGKWFSQTVYGSGHNNEERPPDYWLDTSEKKEG